MRSNEGERLLQQGRVVQADRLFRDILTRLGEEPSFERAKTLIDLARSMKSQGKQNVAGQIYRQTLNMLSLLEQSAGVKRKISLVHTDLADVLRDMGQFDVARQEYEASLEIDKEVGGDNRGTAVTLSQLGTLALKQNDLPEARRRYLEALTIFRANAEPQTEAKLLNLLGTTAMDAGDYAEAEKFYKDSLALSERLNDQDLSAQTCNQLALVANSANRPDEAEQWYKRAIEGFKATAQTRYEATASYNLANLYLSHNRLPEAEQYAHRAREIKETLDLSSEPWSTYSILAQIAEQRGRLDEARKWQQKAKDTRRAFDERSGYQTYGKILQQFDGVIKAVIAAVNGDDDARSQVEALFDTFKEGNWQIVEAIQRIWAGERDGEALTESIDRNSAAIVRRVLMLLQTTSSGEVPTSPSVGEVDVPQGESGEGERKQQDITLKQILNLVIAGAKDDAQAGEQAYQFTQVMQDHRQSPEIRALGKGLQNVLEGLRGEDAVRGLPPEAAQIVQTVLQQLS